ncbi:MAG: hypothetical protein H6767_08345 [Candidatus Peribacteria bacterium]|nr:MAG: hypothetical protein H6767_08345 [Candidatus Peribacteria bacterium]
MYLDDSEKKHLLQLSLRASFDFDSDDSLTKYVDPQIHFNNLQYVPKNLEYIGSEYVHDTKRNLQLRRDANEMFQRMTEDFYDTFKEKIDVVSAYRSYIYQK